MHSMTNDAIARPRGITNSRRFLVATALLLFLMLAYADRVNLSVAAPHIMEEFNLSNSQFGIASSSFGWIYTLVLVPVGVWLDKIGVKVLVPVFLILWSLGAGATGLSVGFGALILSRLLLGFGESAAVPSSNIIVREWAPKNERGFFTGLANAGTLVGSSVGAVAAGILIARFGWRESFVIMGIIGLLFGIVWAAVYRSPEKAIWLGWPERDYITRTRLNASKVASKGGIPIAHLLRKRTVWSLMFTQGCANYTNYLFLTFLPLYFVQERGVDEVGSGTVSGITYGLGAIGAVIIAVVSDRLVKTRDISSGQRRHIITFAMLAAIILLIIPVVTSTPVIIGIIAVVLALDVAAFTLNYALASDLTSDSASTGRVTAFTGFGGNLFGLAAPIVTGALVDATGSYTLPFIVAAILLGLGAACNHFFSSGRIEAQ